MKTKLGPANFLDINYELVINTLGSQEEHKCSHERNLKYDDFLYKRLAIQNGHDLNCSVPFHPPNFTGHAGDNINICGDIASGKKPRIVFGNILMPELCLQMINHALDSMFSSGYQISMMAEVIPM